MQSTFCNSIHLPLHRHYRAQSIHHSEGSGLDGVVTVFCVWIMNGPHKAVDRLEDNRKEYAEQPNGEEAHALAAGVTFWNSSASKLWFQQVQNRRGAAASLWRGWSLKEFFPSRLLRRTTRVSVGRRSHVLLFYPPPLKTENFGFLFLKDRDGATELQQNFHFTTTVTSPLNNSTWQMSSIKASFLLYFNIQYAVCSLCLANAKCWLQKDAKRVCWFCSKIHSLQRVIAKWSKYCTTATIQGHSSQIEEQTKRLTVR